MVRRRLYFALTVLLLLAGAMQVQSAELKPKTAQAFAHYVDLTEKKVQARLASGPYLWIDTLPEGQRQAAYEQLRRGEVLIERLETREDGHEIDIPDGMVHHWVATAFIPKVSAAQVLGVMQDYNDHEKIYSKEVIKSRLLAQDGNTYRVFLRLYKKKIVTVVLNTEHEALFQQVSPNRYFSRSHATRIAEVEEPGTAKEEEKPPGRGVGFLWRMQTYWRLEQREGGVFVECEVVSLTRDIPFAFRWIVKPLVTAIPRESLTYTMTATRAAVERRFRAANTSTN